VEHPLFSVKDSLVPRAVVNVKIFKEENLQRLEEVINKWIEETHNLVVCPGPFTREDSSSSVVITYVPAGKNHDPNRPQEVASPSRLVAKNGKDKSAKESDGGRIA
jgi:hypothetical protein